MADEQLTRTSRFALSAASIALGTALLTGCAITGVSTDPLTGTATVSMSPVAAGAGDSPATGSDNDALGDADDGDEDADADADDTDWDAAAAVTITMDPAGSRADGAGVRIDGSTVTITDTGTYVLRGALAGQVIVAAPAGAVVALVLDGTDSTPPSRTAGAHAAAA